MPKNQIMLLNMFHLFDHITNTKKLKVDTMFGGDIINIFLLYLFYIDNNKITYSLKLTFHQYKKVLKIVIVACMPHRCFLMTHLRLELNGSIFLHQYILNKFKRGPTYEITSDRRKALIEFKFCCKYLSFTSSMLWSGDQWSNLLSL